MTHTLIKFIDIHFFSPYHRFICAKNSFAFWNIRPTLPRTLCTLTRERPLLDQLYFVTFFPPVSRSFAHCKYSLCLHLTCSDLPVTAVLTACCDCLSHRQGYKQVDRFAQTDSQFALCCNIRKGFDFETPFVQERPKRLSALTTVFFL